MNHDAKTTRIRTDIESVDQHKHNSIDYSPMQSNGNYFNKGDL